MPVLPLVGSTISLPGSSRPRFFCVPHHRRAKTTLYRVSGIATLDLAKYGGLGGVDDAV